MVQVNLFQKHLFLHQLTHNMTKDCSWNYPELGYLAKISFTPLLYHPEGNQFTHTLYRSIHLTQDVI